MTWRSRCCGCRPWTRRSGRPGKRCTGPRLRDGAAGLCGRHCGTRLRSGHRHRAERECPPQRPPHPSRAHHERTTHGGSRCWEKLTDLENPLADPVASWPLLCPWQPELAAAHLLGTLSGPPRARSGSCPSRCRGGHEPNPVERTARPDRASRPAHRARRRGGKRPHCRRGRLGAGGAGRTTRPQPRRGRADHGRDRRDGQADPRRRGPPPRISPARLGADDRQGRVRLGRPPRIRQAAQPAPAPRAAGESAPRSPCPNHPKASSRWQPGTARPARGGRSPTGQAVSLESGRGRVVAGLAHG